MKLLFFFCFLSMVHMGNFHPIHVSVMNIEQNEKSRMFKATVKLFISDLEKIVQEQSNMALNLGADNEIKDWKRYVQSYFESRIILMINEAPASFEIIDRNVEDDSVWITFTFQSPRSIRQVEIRNTLFVDLYYDQTNLLILTCNGKNYTKKMDEHDSVFKIIF